MSGSSPNSAENPWPVRTVNTKIADWIHRLGQIWVEGQVTQISRRPGTRTAFLTPVSYTHLTLPTILRV